MLVLETSEDENEEQPTAKLTSTQLSPLLEVKRNQEALLETSQPHPEQSGTAGNIAAQGDSAKKQTTLLCYATQPHPQTEDFGQATSFENVMDAIASLT